MVLALPALSVNGDISSLPREAPGSDPSSSTRTEDLRHQQNSECSQKPHSAHTSELQGSGIPDESDSAIIHISEPKPALLSWEFTPERAGAASPPLICFSNLILPKGGGKNLPVSFTQDSPVPTSKAGPAGELLCVSCPHGDSQESSTHSSSPWGAVHVLPVNTSSPNTHPSPVGAPSCSPKPQGSSACQGYPATLPQVWEREGNLNV